MINHVLRFLLSLIALATGYVVPPVLIHSLAPQILILPSVLLLLILYFTNAVVVGYIFCRVYRFDAQSVFLLTFTVLLLVHVTAQVLFYIWGENGIFSGTYGFVITWVYAASLLAYLLDDRRFLSRADP
jgi:hypothetical protein